MCSYKLCPPKKPFLRPWYNLHLWIFSLPPLLWLCEGRDHAWACSGTWLGEKSYLEATVDQQTQCLVASVGNSEWHQRLQWSRTALRSFLEMWNNLATCKHSFLCKIFRSQSLATFCMRCSNLNQLMGVFRGSKPDTTLKITFVISLATS